MSGEKQPRPPGIPEVRKVAPGQPLGLDRQLEQVGQKDHQKALEDVLTGIVEQMTSQLEILVKIECQILLLSQKIDLVCVDALSAAEKTEES